MPNAKASALPSRVEAARANRWNDSNNVGTNPMRVNDSKRTDCAVL